MNFELPEELAEVRKLARDFAEKEIGPYAAKDDRLTNRLKARQIFRSLSLPKTP